MSYGCSCLNSKCRIAFEISIQELSRWWWRLTLQLPNDRNLTRSGLQSQRELLGSENQEVVGGVRMNLQAWQKPQAPMMPWESRHLALLSSGLASHSGGLQLATSVLGYQPYGSAGATKRLFWEKCRIPSHCTRSGHVLTTRHMARKMDATTR